MRPRSPRPRPALAAVAKGRGSTAEPRRVPRPHEYLSIQMMPRPRCHGAQGRNPATGRTTPSRKARPAAEGARPVAPRPTPLNIPGGLPALPLDMILGSGVRPGICIFKEQYQVPHQDDPKDLRAGAYTDSPKHLHTCPLLPCDLLPACPKSPGHSDLARRPRQLPPAGATWRHMLPPCLDV